MLFLNDSGVLDHSKRATKLAKCSNKETKCSGNLHTLKVSVSMKIDILKLFRRITQTIGCIEVGVLRCVYLITKFEVSEKISKFAYTDEVVNCVEEMEELDGRLNLWRAKS
jgi:hypothetical protein